MFLDAVKNGKQLSWNISEWNENEIDYFFNELLNNGFKCRISKY